MRSLSRMVMAVAAFVLPVICVFGVPGLRVKAEPNTYSKFTVKNSSGNTINYIGQSTKVDIEFNYIETEPPSDIEADNKYTASTTSPDRFTTNDVWRYTNAKLSFYAVKPNDANPAHWDMRAVLENIEYKSSSKETLLQISGVKAANSNSGKAEYTPKTFNIDMDASYFTPGSSNNNNGDDTEKYTSEIVVENVIITDADGERIDQITKDTPRFNVTIVYSDYGLREIDPKEDFGDGDLRVFLTESGGFVPASTGFKGTIAAAAASASDGVPRFRVEFKNLTFNGGTNSLGFQVRYNIFGDEVTNRVTTVVYQARATEDDAKTPPPTPYIIVNQYSYGGGNIEAGTRFTLDLSFKNTSAELPLENIVMTITTPEDLSIASASNTYYIESLAADATMPYSVELEAKPSAKVGSHGVQIDFTYQYLTNNERKDSKTTENIAIPVTQIDRFELDPITEMPSGMVGDEIYMSISFMNRGKSTTYNITGGAEGNLEIIAPAQHYGNLEPGKSDTLDILVIPQEAGELYGEVVVQYEDENTNQKELRTPFTLFVDAQYIPEPPPVDMVDPGAMEPQGLATATIVLCVIGGILIAVPIALYLVKRVKAKGSEDFDEDF